MVVVGAVHDATAAAAFADELPGGAVTSIEAFLDHEGLQVAPGAGGEAAAEEEEEEELEWLSNKDAFPTLDTMEAPAPAQPVRAAVGPRTKGVRRRRRVAAWGPPPVLPPPPPQALRQCRHCGATKTPQWRMGPQGAGTLCNACGVRHMSGRLVPEYRPMSSPTFSPELHSNSHRRILAMRRRRELSAAAAAAGDK